MPWIDLPISAGLSPASVFKSAVGKPSLTSQEPESVKSLRLKFKLGTTLPLG